MIRFDVSPEEFDTIAVIADRAVAKRIGTRQDWLMDIAATHRNGMPLRLKELAEADDFNFMHDVCGIRRHLNRDTGELGGCFVPRFAESR